MRPFSTKEEGCDLIIMGSRGQGGVKGFLGSVSYAVTKESPIDVYKRQVQVTLFIFLITIALNVVLETVGEDALAQFLLSLIHIWPIRCRL